MRTRTIFLSTVAVAVVATAFVAWPRDAREPAPAPVERPSARPNPAITAPSAVLAQSAPPEASQNLPPELFQQLAPGETVALTIPPGLKNGIRCPDGTYLPLLNGVPRAGAISRTRQAGPLPPVVAKTADENGLEWYVHADGSRTTTHWATIEVEGQPREEVLTRHLAPLPDGFELPVAQTPGTVSPGFGPRLPSGPADGQ